MRNFQNLTLHRATNSAKLQAKIRFAFHFVECNNDIQNISKCCDSDFRTGFVRVLENLESPGIWLWHFPGLESPGKKPLVLESPGNLLNSTKNMKCMEGTKEN